MSGRTVVCCGRPVGPTGFCDHCGRRAAVPRADPPTTPAGGHQRQPTVATSTQRPAGEPWGDGEVQSLPAVELPDPAGLVLADPSYPEEHQFCGVCRHPVGRAYKGQPRLRQGFCEHCGSPFSFVPKLRAGERVGDRYDVLGCFARGGLGWVYLATDSHLGDRYVVLKGVIDRGNATARRLADVERDALIRLDHPNIVRIVNFVEHPDGGDRDQYLVMEYVGGLSLRKILERPESLRVEHVITYGKAILAALGYLHGEGLLYCDMKPDNVIHGDKRVKVIDLGATRAIDDRTSPMVGTDRYQVGPGERARHGLTVRSDLHTVGRTLHELLDAASPGSEDVGHGVDSLRRVLARAVSPYHLRFADAAEMAEQLDGVRREILSLRDGRPRPAPSLRFENTAELLDTGLGAVPGLDRWIGPPGRVGTERAELGMPTAPEAAARFPVPLWARDDPAAPFLDAVRASGPRRWLAKLAGHRADSVEIEFARARAFVELGEVDAALPAVTRAEELLREAAAHDWRVSWHHGLIALAKDRVTAAEQAFRRVRDAWPGEIAPTLALGYCAEALERPDQATGHYTAVWRRDNTQVSAAFGLARGLLRRGDKDAAVAVLDEVPETSRHFDAARVAAVRVRVARSPDQRDLADAVQRLPELYLDGESRERLQALVREAALHWCQAGHQRSWDGGAVLGSPVTEHDVRLRLERSFRRMAVQVRDAAEHGLLIDLANSVRPRTLR